MKKFLLIILFIYFPNLLYSNEIDCSELDKLSTDYAKCLAEKSKEQGKAIKEKIDKNLEKSGIKEKYKKFDNKKTLKDLFKKNEF